MEKREAHQQTLPKDNRLRKSYEFVAVLAARSPEALRLFSDWFEVKVLTHPAPGKLRFGFTVGKKFAANSVDRNLVRRILREAARCRASVFSEVIFQKNIGLDVSLRLIRKIDDNPSLPKTASTLKKVLRADADALLDKLFKEFSGK